MSLKNATWIHGTSVQFENHSWAARALRQGYFTTVTPSNESLSGWVHFAIPTPVIVNNKRSKAESVMIRFTTGSHASIGAVHVWDGETAIYVRNQVSYKADKRGFVRDMIPNQPEVEWGTSISIFVIFDGRGVNSWIELIGAGIEFC